MREQYLTRLESTSLDELFSVLDQLGIDHATGKHPPIFTVTQRKKLRTTSTRGTYTTNLFLRNKKGLMWVITCSEVRRLNLPSLATHLQVGRLCFGSPDRLMKYLSHTGCRFPTCAH